MGVRYHFDSIKRLHTESGYLMAAGQLVPTGDAEIVTADNYESTHAVAIHLTDALQWKRLTVTPGARVELIASRSENFRLATTKNAFVPAVMPGVGMYYELVRDIGLLAGVHRGFSPPAPGSDASPEYSVAYEAGARYTTRRLRAEVIGFLNQYSNLTDICTLSSGCVEANLDQQFSAGRARVYGLEVSGSYEPRYASVAFPMTAAYTLTHGEFLNDFTSLDPIYGDVRRGDPLPYIPLHQWNVTMAAEHRWVGLNGALTYVAPMHEQSGTGGVLDPSVRTDEQILLDLGAYVSPLRWLRIYANMRNATTGAYIVGRRPYGARANAPRWLQVGIKASF